MMQSRIFLASLHCDPKKKDGSYVERRTKSIDGLASWVATVVSCLLKKKEREGHHQEEYSDTYGRMVETATKEVVRNVREFEKYWS